MEKVVAKCPECGEEMVTEDVGDVRKCQGCGDQFNLFPNIVESVKEREQRKQAEKNASLDAF